MLKGELIATRKLAPAEVIEAVEFDDILPNVGGIILAVNVFDVVESHCSLEESGD